MSKYDKSITKSYYYSAGSEAYELDPIYRKGELEEKRRRYEQKKARQAQQQRIEAFSHRVKFIAAMTVVLAGCIAIMIPHTMIVKQTRVNNALRDELSQIKSENVSLEADIANKVNLEYVETEATERLGMSEPQSYQISYINVPKQSYSVQYDVEEEEENTEENGFAFAGLGGLFKKD